MQVVRSRTRAIEPRVKGVENLRITTEGAQPRVAVGSGTERGGQSSRRRWRKIKRKGSSPTSQGVRAKRKGPLPLPPPSLPLHPLRYSLVSNPPPPAQNYQSDQIRGETSTTAAEVTMVLYPTQKWPTAADRKWYYQELPGSLEGNQAVWPLTIPRSLYNRADDCAADGISVCARACVDGYVRVRVWVWACVCV